eukprot:1326071-Amorphochlora_amoeboformis.AAC.1
MFSRERGCTVAANVTGMYVANASTLTTTTKPLWMLRCSLDRRVDLLETCQAVYITLNERYT